MYIIVVGGGMVGYGLALELQAMPGHEVTIVEREGGRAGQLREELGEMVVHGDGTEIAFLESVGASRADLVIAVTADDGANLVTCQVAKHWFHVGRAIARVNDPRNEELFHRLGVDSTISATRAVMAQIEATLPEHTVVPLLRLEGSGLRVVNLRLQDGAPAAGRAIKDLVLPRQTLISLIIRSDGALEVPAGESVLRVGDEVIAVIPDDAEDEMRMLITGTPSDASAL
ncbi:MAG: NAD-binding protein [Chloroflexi bacterium]|nr:NAD-binding protein [Chloroflexota bacterium]MDA1003351.1 NAD-binding protein [Chloroflexota bacterium]MQC27785.1 TrkA family potassium uptake protein [Chloroflexota bacterium]